MRVLVLVILMMVSTAASAARLHHERYYQDRWCKGKGVTEYRLSDATRVDCLTDVYAIEFDFANKWAESVGQALHYSRMTGKRAGIVLIIENPAKDAKYVERVRAMIKEFNLPIDLRTVGPD